MACRLVIYLIVAWLLSGSNAQAQATLNLGLEPRANHGQPLALWTKRRGPGGRVQFDSTVFRQGRGSLRLELTESEEPLFMAVYTSELPLDSLRGQVATVSAWVRTQAFRGRAGIYAFATTATSAGASTENVAAVDSLPATMEWRRVELRLPVKAGVGRVGVGLRALGSGRVWFDNMEVRVGKRLLREAPLPGTEVLFLTTAEALAPNWDFERRLPRAASPDPARATVALDSTQPQHGRRSLRLVRTGSGAPSPIAYLGTLKLAPELVGKSLKVMGYWRQTRPSATRDTIRFAYTLLSTGEGSNYENDSPTGWGYSGLRTVPLLPPQPQWTAFSFTIPIPNDYARLAAVALSLRLSGGALELDNFTFALDGKPYAPAGPPVPPLPTAAEQAWLRSALRPLRLATPATAGPDLAALGSFLGSARLVGLGEVTHGSQEIFALNARLGQYCIEQKGFVGLLLEASPAGCAALNDYLRTGQGDPAHLLAALEGWHTPAVLDLVRWLRSYQQAHPATPLLLAGLELRQPEQALAYLGQLVEAKDEFGQTHLRQVAQLLATYRQASAAELDLRRHPDQPRDSLLTPLRQLLGELAAGFDARAKLGQPTSLQLLARQRYYLRLVEQGATWRRLDLGAAENYRQACLAENAHYLSQQAGGKLLLWASNRSVATSLTPAERPMGEWLRATLGPGYLALGVVLGQGHFAARAAGHWGPAALAAAAPGSYEAWLRTGPAAFWLSLSKLELTEANAWLFQNQLLHDIGYAEAHNQFVLHSLRSEFDAVLFIRDSTPAQLLP